MVPRVVYIYIYISRFATHNGLFPKNHPLYGRNRVYISIFGGQRGAKLTNRTNLNKPNLTYPARQGIEICTDTEKFAYFPFVRNWLQISKILSLWQWFNEWLPLIKSSVERPVPRTHLKLQLLNRSNALQLHRETTRGILFYSGYSQYYCIAQYIQRNIQIV